MFWALLLVLLQPSSAWASAGLDIPHLKQPPHIDGSLDDPAWQTAAKVTDFMQFQPKEGVRASETTTAYLGYDSDNLYVAFYTIDSDTAGVRAHLAPRDQFFGDDWVGIVLDPYGDQRRAFEFFSNPLGIQLDLFSKGGNEDLAPDFVWYAAGKLVDDGYVVEMRIPFKSLRFSKKPEQPWRIVLIRNIQRKNEKDSWPIIQTDAGSLFSQMGDMRGIKEVNPGKRLELIPELTGSQAVPYEFQNNSFHTGKTNERLGVNLKYGLTPDWTLDSTYNPDFSQIEADQPQVQVNQRFPLFFPEKRPFFMEGSDLFSTPLRLVHTRTLVDPEYGLRLTGQEGPFSAGVIRARDRSQGGSVFDIVRLNGAVGKESTFGGIYSNRELGAGQFNRVGGVDGLFRFNKIYVFNFQAVDSFTRKIGSQYIEGAAYRAALSREARNFSFDAIYTDLHPNFRADSGFISRVDVRDIALSAGYRHFPSSGPLQSIHPSISYGRIYDHKGFLTDEQVSLNLSAAFPLQTGASIQLKPSTLERFGGIDFYKRRVDFNFSSEPTSYVSGSFDVGLGDQINYGAATPFLGNQFDKSISFTLKPTSRLSLEQRYISSRLDTKSGDRVFDENIWREKIAFQWNKQISTRAIYQYSTLSHSGFVDFLASYLLVPGTAIHVGYDWSFGRVVSALQTTRRLVFAKVSYLFRI